MNDNQIKVINRIRNGMDYAEVIGLLVELTQKPMYSNQFTGREKSMSASDRREDRIRKRLARIRERRDKKESG